MLNNRSDIKPVQKWHFPTCLDHEQTWTMITMWLPHADSVSPMGINIQHSTARTRHLCDSSIMPQLTHFFCNHKFKKSCNRYVYNNIYIYYIYIHIVITCTLVDRGPPRLKARRLWTGRPGLWLLAHARQSTVPGVRGEDRGDDVRSKLGTCGNMNPKCQPYVPPLWQYEWQLKMCHSWWMDLYSPRHMAINMAMAIIGFEETLRGE